MPNEPSVPTDSDYERERGKAELQFDAAAKLWLRPPRFKKISDLMPLNGQLPRVKLDEIFNLAEMCERFIKAELSAYVSLLKRAGIPGSQGIKALETHRDRLFEDTRRRKWQYALDRASAGYRTIDAGMASSFWRTLTDSTLDFVSDELHPRLWSESEARTGAVQAATGSKSRSQGAVGSGTKASPKGSAHLGSKKQDLSGYFSGADLTSKQRECLSLRFEYALGVAEIARRLGKHHSTIQERLKRGREAMDRSRGPVLRRRGKQPAEHD